MNKCEIPGLEFRGRRVLILGVGILRGGIGMARYCYKHGAQLRITDIRTAEQLRPALEALQDIQADYILGRHREEDIDWAEIVVRNPGVPPDHHLLARAKAQNKPIEMEIAYFARHCPAPIIAVTGTKGKTTTTTILHRFLAGSGASVHLAGNMGESAIALLDGLSSDDEVLLEVSSYQLEGLLDHPAAIDIAIVTNVGDDHLDRYGTLENYRNVKASIAKGQHSDNWLILPAWDKELADLCASLPSQKVYIHRGEPSESISPWTESAWNVSIVDDQVVWSSSGEPGIRIADLSCLRLLGTHNRVNTAFAAAAAYIAGRSPAQISSTVDSIMPVPHRLEPITRVGDIEFINDSAASAPLAVVAALKALAGKRVVAIIGGDDKGAARAPMLAALLSAQAPVVLLPGSATASIESDLISMGYKYPICAATDMANAVNQAYNLATLRPESDVVLLSPGFSSHSVFINEFDRGQQFREAASRIAHRQSC
jgi:UDP-N-acetylmuramoylalanine--D-glutamate ligase